MAAIIYHGDGCFTVTTIVIHMHAYQLRAYRLLKEKSAC